MDALERLAGAGADLLGQVDGVLADGGAPPGSPVWDLLRRVGALPSDVLEFGLRLDRGALHDAAGRLRVVADRFARQPGLLDADVGRSAWEGSGAEAFAVVWRALADHIGDGTEPATVSGRLFATASYVEGLADWVADLRQELAEAVARVVSSSEAVTMRGSQGVGDRIEAAARIAVRILQPAADALDAAHNLRERWSAGLAELPYGPPEGIAGPGSASGITRVRL